MTELKGKKILVIDDEPDVTDLVAYNLKAKGFSVETVNNPNAAAGIARSFLPDLVILDIMMPDISGIQLCRILRADPALKNVPIIFLTAKAEEQDRIQGLETGADDYICKPFSTKELTLRVQALLRRTNIAPAQAGSEAVNGADSAAKLGISTEGAGNRVLRAGPILLDPDRHAVTLAGRLIELTATEFKLLHLLMQRRGRVQTREHLLLNVWNYETEIETRTVDTHIRRLRDKLGIQADYIETIRGVGYRFAEDNKPHKS